VVTPGWGDSVQASKAGLLEVGDLFVVNKADRAGTAATVRDLEAMLATAGPRAWRPPVLATVATDGTGVAEVAAAIEAHRAHLVATDGLHERRERRVRDELRGLVLETLAQHADEVCTGSAFDSVVARVAAGSVDLYTASSDLLASER
jgi:LAO/AO transport system kinase